MFNASLQGRTIRYAMLMVVVTYQSVAGTYCDITDFKPSWLFIINIDPVLEFLHPVEGGGGCILKQFAKRWEILVICFKHIPLHTVQSSQNRPNIVFVCLEAFTGTEFSKILGSFK